MVEINGIISEYVQVDIPGEGLAPSRRFDISKIDFDLLRREFAKAKRKNLLLKDLDDLIQQRLSELLFANPQRINYYERYQKIIEDYNREQDRATIEKTFMDLMDLGRTALRPEGILQRRGTVPVRPAFFGGPLQTGHSKNQAGGGGPAGQGKDKNRRAGPLDR